MRRYWTETCSVACIKFLLYKDKISAKLNLSSFTYMLSTQKKYKGRTFMCEATTDGRHIYLSPSATLSLACQRQSPAALPLEKRPLVHFIGGQGGPRHRSVWVREIWPPTAFRTPDLPTRTESPYRLRYSGAHASMLTH